MRIFYQFLFCASIFLSSLATEEVAYAGTDIDEIRERALSFYSADYYEKSVVFPGLRFTCAGSITSVWFIATEPESFTTSGTYPEFQLWNRSNISTGPRLSKYQGSVKDNSSRTISRTGLHVKVNGSDMTLYQYRLETPMSFEMGDVLGIRLQNPLLLMYYLDGGGVRNYIFQSFGGRKFKYIYHPGLEREALLALEVSEESCLDGFLNVETLQQYMEVWNSHDEDATPEDDDISSVESVRLSYVFPSLQFSKNGLLEKWLFAAKLMLTLPLGSNHISIEFQVWRRERQQVSVITTNATSPARTGYINVYEQTVHPPLPVKAGDYIGISVQSSSYLQPQWVSGSGEWYQRIPHGSEGANGTTFAFAGQAIPLFAAQIQVTAQPVETSSTSSLVTSSEPRVMPSSLPLNTATSVSSESSTTPPTQHTLQPTSTDSTTATSTSALPTHLPVPPSRAPPKSRDSTNKSSAIAAVVVVSIVILISAASIGIILFVIYMRRKRKEQAAGGGSEQQQKRSSFFDNPVYEQLQKKVPHKESSIVDPLYLEIPAGSGRGLQAATGDGDSGYAEPGRIVVTPSRSTTATPVPSSPLRIPSSPTSDPTFHTYHTLEQSQLPQDYIEPCPSSQASGNRGTTAPDTSNLDIHSTRNRKTIDHKYHVLDPNTGGYHRLFTNGIYVPTQEERRQSAGSDDNYAAVGERLYSTLAETSQQKALPFFEECDIYWKPACTSGGLYSQLAQKKYREILHTQIKVQHPLGAGHFGEVNKGEWQSDQGAVEVAVKTLKRGSSEEDTVRFLQEAAIMGQFRHPNIVQLHGVVTLAEHAMIILEYLSQGDLGTVLVNRRPMPGSAVQQDMPFLLLRFCIDIASGMEYLQRKAFVHRDLAARNILVSKENICKIGDFGMSRDLLNENYYVSKGGMIPLKWTAPEALHYRKYSTASDVWSYGVVMYEIWSLGHKPFEGYTNLDVQKMLDRGERLAPPPGCPRGVYSLMMECWHPDSSSRPTFLHLLKTLNSSRSQLLSWSHEDTWGMAEAIVLGAPLHEGRKLYTDLQNTHTQQYH